MRNDLPFRQVHLDFHTSGQIPGIGAAFNPAEFVETLVRAHINSITLFARGHHGWAYYPSQIFAPHPHLERPDLLGEMIEACHKHGIATPVYITVQWDNKTAREHPEWRMVEHGNSDFSPLEARWFTLCINHQGYQDLVIRNALEVMELYPQVEGLFFDIVLGGSNNQCLCPQCLRDIQEKGLDCENPVDRKKHYFDAALDFMTRCSETLWSKYPELRIIYNSGHVFKGRDELLEPYSHLELESLPTGGWGYDHFPVSAAYVSTKSKKFLGMTGKFHTTWGEFGGFKRPEALEYETAQMLAMGARCSIGDQLHPSGKIDHSTYQLIGSAYRKVKELECYVEDAKPLAEIAILSEEAINNYHQTSREAECDRGSDSGCARMLLQEHQTFAVVDAEADLAPYKVLILPDSILLDTPLAKKLHDYAEQGGKIIASGVSGLTVQRDGFAMNWGLETAGRMTEYAPNYMQLDSELRHWDRDLWESPFVMYRKALLVRPRSTDLRVVSHILNPYFQRSWEHFCSHRHTPYVWDEAKQDLYGAVFAGNNWVYFAHPVFSEFHQTGQPLLKFLFRGALRHLLAGLQVRTNLPSAARVFVNRQEQRVLIHLLYANIRKQGDIEIIEDRVTLTNTTIELRLPDKKVHRIFLAQTGEELRYSSEGDYLKISVPEFTIHGLLVLEYQ